MRIDPTIQMNPSAQNAYKSDGSQFTGLLYVGNTRENNTNRYWRSIATFGYGSIPGNFIADAQIGIGYAGYDTTSQYGWVRHASNSNYNGTGDYVADYTLGTGSTQTSGTGIAQKLVDRFALGDYGAAWMISGNEGSVYSHKQVTAAIAIAYWPFLSAGTGAPGNGSTGVSIGPSTTLNATASNPGGRPLTYGFDISTDPTFTNTSVSVGSGWGVGLLRPGFIGDFR